MTVIDRRDAMSDDYLDRFGGIARLFGREGLARLRAAHVCVVGVGGVGSWTVEGLARSGVGALTLIDLDEVYVTNVNRQLPALTGTVGMANEGEWGPHGYRRVGTGRMAAGSRTVGRRRKRGRLDPPPLAMAPTLSRENSYV